MTHSPSCENRMGNVFYHSKYHAIKMCIAIAARMMLTMVRSNQTMTMSFTVRGILVARTMGMVVENMMI